MTFTRRVTLQDLALVVRQLAAMLSAGIPIVDALSFLARGEHPELSRILADVSKRVAEGNYLSASLGKHPRTFPSYLVSLVRLGENSGSLVEVLNRLAHHLERSVGFQKRMAAALAYPAVLLVASLSLIWLLSFHLLPSMTPLFTQLKVPLPWLTRAVLAMTGMWCSPQAVLAVILLVVTLLLIHRQLQEAEEDSALRRGWDELKLRAPLLGALQRQAHAAQLMRMLSLTTQLGMPLSRSMELLEGSVDNVVVAGKLRGARHELATGDSLSAALHSQNLFTPGTRSLVYVGEETGRLAQMAKLVADMYDQDIELSLARLSALVEPLILGGTSVFVGIVCVATFLPWISLLSDMFK